MTSPTSSMNAAPGRKVLGCLIPVVLVVAAIGVLLYFGHKLATRVRPVPPPQTPVPVDVVVEDVKVIPTLDDTITLPAVVEANRVINVSAEVAGRIVRIPPREGTPCKRDDLLVELDTEMPAAEHARARSDARFAEKEFERINTLFKGGAATEKQADEARSRMEIAQATETLARIQLERTHITAPGDGILNELPVEVGEYVQPGMRVAQIVDMSTAKVVVHVPEPETPFFQKGKAAKVLVETEGRAANHNGVITYISQIADDRTRTTRIEVDVENHDGALRSGQILRVTLQRRELSDVVMVPLYAIIPLEVGYRVYVVEDDTARVRTVTASRVIKKDGEGIDRIQILSGLKAGDRLIVAGHRFVGDGQKVHIVPPAREMNGAPVQGRFGK